VFLGCSLRAFRKPGQSPRLRPSVVHEAQIRDGEKFV
jgi:hypothetical protein